VIASPGGPEAARFALEADAGKTIRQG